MIISNKKLDRILPAVQKPARYTGGEYNSVRKDWAAIRSKVALVFPDVYDLGMSNLGLAILYDILNRQPDVLAERVFVPWVDMIESMQAADIPLYSLESRHELRDFDLIGLTLPYEQLYTNALTVLDLARIPLLSAERDASYPLVCAGGNAGLNPEPMADFIDFFVVGEGEAVILEIIQAMAEVKRADRESQLRRLTQIPGVYVPRFYEVSYHERDGTIAKIEPRIAEAPPTILKRIMPTLPPPVTRFIVPFVDVVFNRPAVELQRGCSRGCRFCQAGMALRPVRERPLPELLESIDRIITETGYEEIGLMSLSSSDYSQIGPLVEALAERYQDQPLNISLPSLRIDSVSADLVEKLERNRKSSSFTFAPEAATDRMRRVINKYITAEDLLQTADEVYSRGWRAIKLYFMIGQPTETEEDVRAIAELARQVLFTGEKHHGRKSRVRIGVSTFVPQPHTPFQWAGLASPAEIEHKQEILQEELRRFRGIRYDWTPPEQSLMEAFLSLGDRRLGPVIKTAWEKGCRFDAWPEHHRPEVWRAAFAEHQLDPAWYAHRQRSVDESLPWDHISAGIERRWLIQDWLAAHQGQIKPDCRQRCYNCGILLNFKELWRQADSLPWQCPPV